jgi:hypothetical protein
VTGFEDRLREAFDAQVEQVRPHGHARAENIRRLSRARRRRRIAAPAVSIVTAAVMIVTFAVARAPAGHVQSPAAQHGPSSPDTAAQRRAWAQLAKASSLPTNLDPPYRPTSPVVTVGDVRMWFAGQGAGALLCWRQDSGGGDCRGWTLQPGGHAAMVGMRVQQLRGAAGKVRYTTVRYGIADGQVTAVSPPGPPGAAGQQTIIARPGLPWHIWQSATPLRNTPVVFTNSHGTEIDRAGVLGFTGSPASVRPLTSGVPLFTYRLPTGDDATMHAFIDGGSLGLGSAESEGVWEQAGITRWFGQVESLVEGPDAPWWYGILGAKITRVVLKFGDGRTFNSKIVRLGPYRAFAVHAPGVVIRPGHHAGGMLTAYDSAGVVLATYRV